MHQVALGNLIARGSWLVVTLCSCTSATATQGASVRTIDIMRAAIEAQIDLEVQPIPVLECSIVRIVGAASLSSVTAGIESAVLHVEEPAQMCGESESLSGMDFRTIDSVRLFADSAEVFLRYRHGVTRAREVVGVTLRGLRPRFLFRHQTALGHGDPPGKPSEAYLRRNPGLDSVRWPRAPSS